MGARIFVFSLFVTVFAACSVEPDIRVPIQTGITGGPEVAPAKASDEEKIRSVFEQYRKALLDGNGEAAAQWIDAKTTAWFESVLRNALTVKRSELRRLTFTQHLFVLLVRQEFHRKKLEQLSAGPLFVVAIERGWIVHTGIEKFEPAAVVVNGSEARLSFKGLRKQAALPFVKDDGKWRFALWKAFASINAQMDRNPREFMVRQMLEKAFKVKLDERIWDGPID